MLLTIRNSITTYRLLFSTCADVRVRTETKVGTLGETEFKGEMGFLAVDAEDNPFCGSGGETLGANKLIMVSMETNQSSIIIDNAGQAPLNQPCVIDHGNGLVIPTDQNNTYWMVHSADFWQPKRRDYMAAKGRMPTK